MRTPSYWKGMPFTARAAWLVSTRQAATYEDACSMLAKLRKAKPPTPIQAAVAQKEYWWQK